MSKKIIRTTFVLACLLSNVACTSYQSAMREVEQQSIGYYPTIVTAPFLQEGINEELYFQAEEDLFRLTQEQAMDFLNWYQDPARADITPHKRLYEYLEQYTFGFDYRGETLVASEAMRRKAGNCLSLAMMTTALARVAGIETGYQKVNATPVFKRESNVITLSHHVRTYLYDPTWQPAENEIAFVRPRLVVDYFPNRYDVPGEAVSETQFMGMYFRNLAAEALVAGDINTAFWLAHKALSLSANDAENINIMAIIYRRAGLPDVAEQFYQYGMDNAQNNTNLLSNYAYLLDSLQRIDEAERIRQKLLDFPDNNPYSWMKLGHEAYESDNNVQAIYFYNRAMKLAPYLDEVYFGLAKSHYRNGDFAEAARAMKLAAEKSWEQSQRDLYYAKLSAMRARQPE